MNILLVLIPVTLLVIGIAVALFFWAVNHQQFDDLESPGVLPLMDDAPTELASTNETGAAAESQAPAANNLRQTAPENTGQQVNHGRDPDQG